MKYSLSISLDDLAIIRLGLMKLANEYELTQAPRFKIQRVDALRWKLQPPQVELSLDI